MSKRVLLISYVALMATTPNGRTMQSLMQGIPAKNLSLFCSYGFPDNGSCAAAYKVSNHNALRSLMSPSASGGELNLYASVTAEEAMKADSRKGERKAWKYLLKECIWSLGRWKNKKLDAWIQKQKIDCIVCMYGDSAAIQNFAIYVSQKFSIPLIVYTCEDYYFKDYNYIDFKDHSLAFRMYHRKSKRATQRLMKQATALIVNSDTLGEQYQTEFNISQIRTVMMASQMKFVNHAAVRKAEDCHITYLGALGSYRNKALMEVAEALHAVNPCLKLDVYGKANDDRITDELKACPYIYYGGFVSYDEVQNLMSTSALILEVINQDTYICKDKKFGFSTKYADCFACGTPFMVYAPKQIIETKFALEHDCAFVADHQSALEETLRAALFDAEKRKKQIESAQKVTQQYFNTKKNIAIVDELIETVIHTNNLEK